MILDHLVHSHGLLPARESQILPFLFSFDIVEQNKKEESACKPMNFGLNLHRRTT